MHGDREDVNGGDIFVYESFNLADFHPPSVTRSCSVATGDGDIGDSNEMTGTKEGVRRLG